MNDINPYAWNFGAQAQGNNSFNGQYRTPQVTFPNQQPIYQNQAPPLFGKIVDGYEVARATEVPMGVSGVFLKPDRSEVYVKSWNANGECPTTVYRPIPTELPKQMQQQQQNTPDLTEAFDTLIKKMDALEQEVGKLTKQLGD